MPESREEQIQRLGISDRHAEFIKGRWVITWRQHYPDGTWREKMMINGHISDGVSPIMYRPGDRCFPKRGLFSRLWRLVRRGAR